MHYLTSIFLTLLIFLTGGNLSVAKNQASSASLADLCASSVRISVEEVFHRQDAKGEKVFKALLEAFPKSPCDFRSLPISAFLGDLCALAVNSSSTHTTTGPIATIIPTQTQSFTINDRLTTDTYDSNGNTTSSLITDHGSLGTNASDIYSFDNRLIRRTTPDGKTIDLTYNPEGHRLSKFITQNALTQRLVHYLTDANNPTGYAQVIKEKHPLEAAGSQLKKVNLYGHDLICSVGLQPSSSSSSALPPPASLLYYNYDGLGSVRSITNSTGDLTETYDYDAYGTLIGLNKRNPATGILESLNTENFNLATSSYLFTGEQWDSDLEMYFLRARYLNTNTGRFHTQDSYEGCNGEPLTLHKYLYANGNPAMFTDPTGNTFLGEVTAVLGSLVRSTITSIGAISSSSSIAISGAILRAGLVPISALSMFTQRVGLPLVNRIVNVFASRPDVIPSIDRWTNGIIGARAHFFNEALKNSERFSTIANRLGVQSFRWGADGFKFFTEIADDIANLPVGQSVYGTVYRISNGGQSITFIRTSGNGPHVGSDVGVAVVKTGNLIASFRDAVGQVILGGGGL